MTVIAALVENANALLIAADSGQTEMPGEIRSVYVAKLHKHPSVPLAWAAAGDAQIGLDLSAWLDLQSVLECPDWTVFRDRVATQLARLNGRRRELAILSGAKLGEEDTASVLMCGWIGGRPEIVEIDDEGGTATLIDENFRATGSGGVHASIAYRTLLVAGFTGSAPDVMRVTMTVAATTAQLCSLPVQIWRVTPAGISDALAAASMPQAETALASSKAPYPAH